MDRFKFIRFLWEISEEDRELVGGKAYNLGLMIKAGLPVPPGFCILSTAYSPDLKVSEELSDEIARAYELIGKGEVAVRSSATAEDTELASFAGQGETFLNVKGIDQLIEAIKGCWRSISSSRLQAYRERMNLEGETIKMAVVVQKMVHPDFAGVIFTQAPLNPDRLIVESGSGYGERVVSGEVTPDRFVLDRHSLRIIETALSPDEDVHLPEGKVEELAQIGMEIERLFGEPRDIEWAIRDGRIFILQSRPITSKAFDEEMERLRREEIERLRRISSPGGTVWAGYNLSEVLPEPTPMTWSIISEFMSGNGGFGTAYREVGFLPGKEVRDQPPIDLICGRPYYNLSREPRFYFADFPFEHDFQELKSDPRKAMYPEPKVNVKNAPPSFLLKFPYYLFRMLKAELKMRRLRRDFDRRMKEEIIPRFVEYIGGERRVDIPCLSGEELIGKLEEWREMTLFRFAKEAFKATILARFSLTNLTNALKKVNPDEAIHLAQELTSALEDDPTVRMNVHIWKVARGEMMIDEFLELYGHRAVGEFELAQMRWREDPSFVERMAAMFKADPKLNPEDQFKKRLKERCELEERIKREAGKRWRKIEVELNYARRYLPFRESVKHYMMMGYELLRLGLLELGRRYLTEPDDIFFLTWDEVPQLIKGRDLSDRILERRRRREKLLRIALPDVIFSDELDRIGDPPLPEGAEVLEGVPVSAGVAEGEALVMERANPELARSRSGYILVCPSTDPCWTPLFLKARGLVMERGGVLSHGAIVAREFGIPAVANVSGAVRSIKTGQRIRVDGNKGIVILRGL